jgi:Kef-type K+ transport system membrane component KefB
VLAGIILGPSVLGNIPGWIDHVFPPHSLPVLTLIANVGLILYMFLVGLELDPITLFSNAKNTLAISIMGIIFPFSLGALASFVLYQHRTEEPGHHVPFPSFLLFTGVAMSITAFPVLARILTDLNLVRTNVGIMTLGSAAIDDALAWCMLILVISILKAKDMKMALYVFLLVAAYGSLLLIFLRPFITRCLDRLSSVGTVSIEKSALAITFMAIFVSSWFTEVVGVHTIFGAFLLVSALHDGSPGSSAI